MIASQNTEIMTQVIVSTPPKRMVEKTGTSQTRKTIPALRCDDFSPAITSAASIKGGEAF
jgi:hypothetical protein